MKTVTHKAVSTLSRRRASQEQILLKRMLKKYHAPWSKPLAFWAAEDHVMQNPGTLLVRFLGLCEPQP